jgi:hypothetical protein
MCGDLFMTFTCPVCFFDKLEEPARPYNICDCCGTEFGNDDDRYSHDELRNRWIDAGAKWFFGTPPFAWSAAPQLLKANVKIPYATWGVFTGTSNVVVKSKYVDQDSHIQLALAS